MLGIKFITVQPTTYLLQFCGGKVVRDGLGLSFSVFFLFFAVFGSASLAQINIDTVVVGNEGNAADATGYGSVGYTYAIGTYDVTLNQFTTFLNAVAKTDTYGLYNSNLATDPRIAGILRTGSSGSYNYSVIGDGQRPVTYVGPTDAARFCNWLSNGQPTGVEGVGTTETGAYTLSIGLEQNPGASWWIPTENEWYKAAYYDPALNGGAGGYWAYATRSNTAPGNNIGNLANQANYWNGVYSVTQSSVSNNTQNYLTAVGAFSNSKSAYGTYDQDGNVYQWNSGSTGDSWGIRGGSCFSDSTYLQSSSRDGFDFPPAENIDVGFRVATVPEPGSALLFGLGIIGMSLIWRTRDP